MIPLLGWVLALMAVSVPTKTVSGDRTLNLARKWINIKIDECCTPTAKYSECQYCHTH